MTEPQQDLGALLKDFGRTPGLAPLVAPVGFFILGAATIIREGVGSVIGLIGVALVVIAVALALFALVPTVTINQQGLFVRDAFFRTHSVPWHSVGELRPPTPATRHGFFVISTSGETLRIDRLSLRPRYGTDQAHHPDVATVLAAHAAWKAHPTP